MIRTIDGKVIRKGNWIVTDDSSWIHLNAITEICLEYEGSETRDEDYYQVSVLTKMTEFWLPNSEDREVAKKHHNFFNQMSDQQKRGIFLGGKNDCNRVVEIIMIPEVR